MARTAAGWGVVVLGIILATSVGCDTSPSINVGGSSTSSSTSTGGGSTATPAPSAGADWPMWGGTPLRNMVNTVEKNIPHEWDPASGKNIKWTAGLGSQSYGNPVIVDGRIFVGTNNERQRNPEIKGDKGIIMCFRESDGEFLWQAVHDKLPAGRVNDWPYQGICSAPVVEGNRLWYVSNRCELVCADVEGFTDGENDGPYTDEKYTSKIDGDFIWVLDMMEELTVFPHNLATSSPVIAGDLVFVVTSNGVDEGHIDLPSPLAPSFIAVDKNTGRVVWEDDSPGRNILHGQWSSPAYGVIGGVEQVIFPGGDGWLYSFEPKSGKLIWKFDCNPKDSKWELYGNGTRNNLIATPVIHEDRVYIAVGQDPEHGVGDGHLYRINPVGKAGDITEGGADWHYGDKDFKRTMSTVAAHDGLLYAADLAGFLHCLDLKTGKPYWVFDMLAAVWGSPTVIDGKLYLGDEDGDIMVLQTGKTLKRLVNSEDGINMKNAVLTTPVAANGVLYIVNRTTLFAIQQTGK